MTVQPATIATRIVPQMQERIRTMDRFIPANDFSMLRWEEEANLLAAVSAIEAAGIRGTLAHMRGDIEAAVKFFDRAVALGAERYRVEPDKLMAFSNLGFATEALNIFRTYVDIKYQNLGENIPKASCFGAFQHCQLLMKQADAAKLTIEDAVLPIIGDAAEVLSNLNVSDDQCALVIDAAGEVLRARSLFWQELHPRLSVNKSLGTVAMRFRVATTAAEASDLTMEVADKLIERDLDRLPFFVSFIGTAN